jgi:hypothetical protein
VFAVFWRSRGRNIPGRGLGRRGERRDRRGKREEGRGKRGEGRGEIPFLDEQGTWSVPDDLYK